MTPKTPESLLDAAEALFSDRGYDSVGIREIAERAGANLAAIRYHFGGKRELYIEVVRRAMRQRATYAAWLLLETPPKSRREAATILSRFIRAFLHGILTDSRTAVCARLCQQEASAPSEAIDEVVRHFMAPNLDALARTIAPLVPDCDASELPRLASFILGILLHHHYSRAFIERLSERSLDQESVRDSLANDIARFALRALRVGEAAIDRAIEEAHPAPAVRAAVAASKGLRK
jgi:AcrR family transcriptional regulator